MKPNSDALLPVNLPADYENLSEEQQETLQNWIFNNFDMIHSYNLDNSSYGMKKLFENSPQGFYITNGQFKGAMLKRGYKATNRNDINWYFNVSKRSVQRTRRKVLDRL
ncbi:TPA: hypothetical protein ACGN8S_002212 [Bacillus cereus]